MPAPLLNAFRIEPGPIAAGYATACQRLEQLGFADALWNRRPEAWTSAPSTQKTIANRLGWLGALDFVTPHLPRLTALGASVRADGTTDVILLGMGGSSLAPEVLRQILGVAPGFPRFRMLDSVDPDAVRAAMDQAATSIFVLASKSGSTIEPTVMAAEARRRLIAAGHGQWGARMIAITDEGSPIHAQARAERFRDVFINPSDIGGRYSALSFFGLVPAALMGADIDALVAAARLMEQACRNPVPAENPGLALGAFMAAAWEAKRDKLTLRLDGQLGVLGLWIEQLVAESTGKQGKGIAPIAGESGAVSFGTDRAHVSVEIGTALDGTPTRDEPVAALRMAGPQSIGAEFLRWEVATAAASALMGVNPFDEPNVQQAKDATRALLDLYRERGQLPIAESHATVKGARLTLSTAAQNQLVGASPLNFLDVARTADYVAILAYLPPDAPSLLEPVERFRTGAGVRTGCATMFGLGPRYLHSTGQLHKGGSNNGVFVIVTAAPGEDLAIPDAPYSFAVLEMAQAIGDFQSLDRAGRRALHIHFADRNPQQMGRVLDEIATAESSNMAGL